MIGSRDIRFRRLGAAMAALALYLQLAFAGWGMLALAAHGDPGDAFSEHALCLAGLGDTQQPTAPTDGAPSTPGHDHLAFCCLWHAAPGVAPQTAFLPQPIAYAAGGHHEPDTLAFTPAPRRSPVNARAPPPLA